MQNYTIAFSPYIPAWSLVTFAIIALILFMASLRNNFLKAFARLAFAFLLLLFLAQPQLVKENRKPLKDIALIAVDKSQSQDLGHRNETTKQALAYLQSQLKKLPNLETRIIDVASRAKDETKVFDSIETAISDVPDSQRAGVILLTDGQVTDAPSRELFKNTPLHVLLTGSRRDKDREIKILNSPGYSVIGETAQLKFRIENHNINSSSPVTVRINYPDGTSDKQIVPVNEDQTWPLPVNNAGQNIFELSIDPVDNELSLLNNRAIVNVQGVRNRLHVLLVSGEPYPGARMWRDLLKADPGVDLVHFTILRSPDKIDMTPTRELSLIAFPFQELFERKLNNFDLIIMDRFSLNTVLPDYYFQNMRDYVLKGGALLEISGPSYATPSSIHETSLGQILPGNPDGPLMRQSFKPKVTDLGKTHPVTMPLTHMPDWGNWLQQVPVQPVAGDVLMTGIDNNPLLILEHSGKGRVAQLTSDQIWLWARGYQGGGPTTELLRRIVHWLMKEPELDENALDVKPGDDKIHIRTRQMPEAAELTATLPDNTQQKIIMTKDKDGWLTGDLVNAGQGIYKFSDGDRQQIISLGDITTPEFSNIISTEENLRSPVSASSGGMVWYETHPRFDVRLVSPQSRYGSDSWIDLKRNNSSSLVSSEAKPILPPGILAVIGLLAGFLMWWNESRRKSKA